MTKRPDNTATCHHDPQLIFDSGAMETDKTEPGDPRRPGGEANKEASLGRQLLRQRMFPRETEPSSIGRYLVLRFVGSGGMGRVFAAYDPVLDRKVAIKLLPAELGGELTQRTRLLREAQALAKLSHPNVVQVYEAGEHEGVFVAMEFIEGQTLGDWVAGGGHPQSEGPSARAILDMYLQAGRGLAAAHRAGLVHRDFKPSNVLVDDLGTARVLDFGLVAGTGELAPIGQGSDPEADTGPHQALDVELTTTGTLLGTPAYMAPEQFMGAPVDACTDQFGFCVALFEALTGSRPFTGASLTELRTNVSQGLRSASIEGRVRSRRVARALDRGLATDPAQRWPSMDELLDALRPPSRAKLAAAAAAVVVPLVGVGAWTTVDSYEARLDTSAALLDAQVDRSAAEAERADRLAFEREVLDAAQRVGAIESAANTPGRELEALALAVEVLAAEPRDASGGGPGQTTEPVLGSLASVLAGNVPLASLDRGDRLVRAVDISDDGARLVTTPSRPGPGEGTLELWSTAPAKKLRAIELGELELGPRAPAISPDARFVAVSEDRRCVVFELDSGARALELDACTDPLFGVDGTLFAEIPCPNPSTEADQRATCAVAAWTVEGEAQRWTQPVPGRSHELLVHPDGQRLIVRHGPDADEAIDLLATDSGAREARLNRAGPRSKSHPSAALRPGHLALSGDGRKLAAVETDGPGRLVLWDLDARKATISELEPSAWGWYFSLPLLSHDGSELMIHGKGAGMALYDLDHGQLIYTQSWGSSRAVATSSGWLAINTGEWFERPEAPARQTAQAADDLVGDAAGRFVVSVSGGSARLWSPGEHLVLERWVPPRRETISGVSDAQIVTQLGYGAMQVYARDQPGADALLVDDEYANQRPLRQASDRPTRLVYMIGGDYDVHELGAAQPLCHIDGGRSEASALSPDGQRFALTDQDGGVAIWDVETCRLGESFEFAEAAGEGELPLRYGADGSIHARTPLGLNLIRDPSGRLARVDEQCGTDEAGWSTLSPDGRLLLSCCSGVSPEHNPGRIWDVASGELLREVDLRGYAMAAQFSHDGELILINAGQHEIAVLDTSDGRERFRIPGRLWPGRAAKTRATDRGLVLDLVTHDRGLVTMPLSAAGLVDAACELLAGSELALRSAPHCSRLAGEPR